MSNHQEKMPKMPRTVYEKHSVTQTFPAIDSLRSAEEAAVKINISAARLLELAEAGYAPHYRIDGGPPMFAAGELRAWAKENLIQRFEGHDIPFEIIVSPIIKADEFELPPVSLLNVSPLMPVSRDVLPPGVYFLCKGDEVVYVGQSVVPHSRIHQHAGGFSEGAQKDFDRAYMIPVPRERLSQVEGAFIRALRPKYNADRNGRYCAPAGNAESDKAAIGRYLDGEMTLSDAVESARESSTPRRHYRTTGSFDPKEAARRLIGD